MKKLALFVLIFTMVQQFVFAETVVYSDNGKFGLKDSDGNIVAAAKYKKLIRLGEQSWIMQSGS